MSDRRLVTTQFLSSGPAVAAAPVRTERSTGGSGRRRTTRSTRKAQASARVPAVLAIAEAVAGVHDPVEVARRACEAVRRSMPDVERASIRLVDPMRGGAVLLAASGYPSDYADDFAVLPLDERTPIGKAILTGTIQHAPDHTPPPGSEPVAWALAAGSPLSDQTLRQVEPGSLIAVPLPALGATSAATPGQAWGALILSVGRAAAAGPEDQSYLLTMGHLLAQALANAQAHAQAQAQQRSTEQLTAVLASIEDAVWVAGSTGRVVLANSAAARMAGVERTEDPYRPLDQWNPLDAPRDFEGQPIPPDALPIARALRGEHFTYQLLRTRNPLTGAEVYLRVAGAPLRDTRGAVVGAVITGNDITRRLMFERQRDAMVAATGHDLRNPLTALKGSIQLLMRSFAGPNHEYEAASLARMLRQVNRIAYLVSDLMDVGLLAEKRLTLTRAPMDLVALARDVVEEERANIDRCTIVFEAAAPTLQGEWDQARLERVLVNLIDNAAKFSPAGSTIAVRVWRETARLGGSGRQGAKGAASEEARVSVADQGQGIAAEHLPRLFEWYFRAPEAADQTRGSGIGLAISRELLAAHGGRIWAESSGPGQGSTFHLALPLPTSTPKDPAERPRPRRRRALAL